MDDGAPRFMPMTLFERELPNAMTRVWLAILFRKSRLGLPPVGHSSSQGPERSLLCAIIPYSSGGTSSWGN